MEIKHFNQFDRLSSCPQQVGMRTLVRRIGQIDKDRSREDGRQEATEKEVDGRAFLLYSSP